MEDLEIKTERRWTPAGLGVMATKHGYVVLPGSEGSVNDINRKALELEIYICAGEIEDKSL